MRQGTGARGDRETRVSKGALGVEIQIILELNERPKCCVNIASRTNLMQKLFGMADVKKRKQARQWVRSRKRRRISPR